MKYKNLTLGGTFDHLHLGHEALLKKAFAEGETVWLGITTKKFISDTLSKVDKWAHLIEPFETRKEIVEAFLQKNDWLTRAKIIPIDDRFGTTLVDQKIEAIVVSPETKIVALEINELRAEKSWSALSILEVPWVLAKDAKPIHSVRMRSGEIDESGNLFTLPVNWGQRRLGYSLRETLKNPLGTLFKDTSKDHETAIVAALEHRELNGLLITVGDAVTDACLHHNVLPSLSVVDFSIERKKVYESLDDFGFPKSISVQKLKNPAGTLSYDGFTVIDAYFKNTGVPTVIVVDGEEDLLTLMAILRAPLYTSVLYGQPGEGVVSVEVTVDKKKEIKNYLSEFTES